MSKTGSRVLTFATVALGVLVSVVLTGCTAVGLGVGAVADWSHGKKPVEGLSGLRTGTNVTVWCSDGRKLDGRYLGCRDSIVAPPVPVPTAAELGAVVPLRAVVVLGTEAGAQQIPIETVTQVSVPVVRGKWIGFVLGALADAAVVYASWVASGGGGQTPF